MFQVMKAGKLEKRVAALGGHGFAVFSPPGHWPISVQSARQFGRLIHETDKEKEILRSGYIGGMSRYGGVNFSVNQPGGYRKKATALITIEPQNLALAIASGFDFFENRFSGIVFGAGEWRSGSWEGKIPLCFLHLVSFGLKRSESSGSSLP